MLRATFLRSLGIPIFLITAALLICVTLVPLDSRGFDNLSRDGPLWRWRQMRKTGTSSQLEGHNPPEQEQDPLVECVKQQGPFLRDSKKPGHVVAAPNRAADVTDAFDTYARFPWCWLNSLELHDPFEPLCSDRKSLLTAMTEGGRSGFDMPYAPRGCDMRWYRTEDVCRILSKYSKVWIVGDSMMRHLASAMHVLLRENLFNGGRTSWKDDPEGDDCTCEKAYSHGGCLFNEAFSSTSVWENDPDSMKCPQEVTAPVEYYIAAKYPADKSNFPYMVQPPQKPAAFVLGSGLWNDLNETATKLWIEQIESFINSSMPFLTQYDDAFYPRLYISPSVGGEGKPAIYKDSQGHLATARFELNLREYAIARGMDHLGTYNLTVQSISPDGTHAGWRSNLIKAQMVLNWLDRLEWADG